MAGLEIQIGADSSDLQKKIKEAEFNLKELSKLKLEQIKLGIDTKEINGNIASVKKSLNDLKTVSKDTGAAISGMAPRVASGSNALMQFSRIAQDAPYGIIGIGNNITATVEAFGYLKNQTGSTGSALKAMAGSIVGSGGVLLAVSLLTTGLTYMSQQGLTVGDVVNKLTGNFDAFGRSIQKANEEAVKSSSSQISAFKAYADAAQDSNLSLEQRLIAVKKLRDIAPYYLKNLSDEKILYGDLSGVIKNVTTALLAQARAKAYGSLLDEKAVEQVKVFTDIQKELNQAVKDFKIPTDQISSFEKAIKEGTGALLRYLNGVKKAPITPSDFIDFNALENLSEKYKQLGKLNGEAYKLGLKISAETKESLPLDFTETKTKAAPKPKKYKNPNPKFDSGNNFLGGGIVNPNLGLQTPDLGVDEAAIEAAAKLKAGLEAQRLLIEDFNSDVNSLIEGSLMNTFSSLGDAIGDALASGGNVLNAVGKSLLQSLGSFLSDMGGLLIKYGTLAVVKGKLDLAILTGGPVSIAAGVAAIGVGIALKAAGAAIGKATSGGSVSTGASVSSPSSSTGSSSGGSSFQGGTVVFEISGQSLIGVLSNTLDKNRRLGGSLVI